MSLQSIITTENTIFLVFLLLVIIQIYINYFYKDTNNISDTKKVEQEIEEPLYKKLGTPSNIINGNSGRIYTWEIEKPNPWNVIVYIETDKFPYKFSFKHNLDANKNIIKKWTSIIPNISYNNNILLIPAKDENSALVILNLLLKNIMNEITFDNIINNELIPKSLAKISNFKIIRTKILEQINELSNTKQTETSESDGEDLAEVEPKLTIANNNSFDNSLNGLNAYGGGEFSFL